MDLDTPVICRQIGGVEGWENWICAVQEIGMKTKVFLDLFCQSGLAARITRSPSSKSIA